MLWNVYSMKYAVIENYKYEDNLDTWRNIYARYVAWLQAWKMYIYHDKRIYKEQWEWLLYDVE